MRNIVVAYGVRDMAIGRENGLPWAGQLPSDMEHFRRITDGQTVIMGRKTFESIPETYRPLRNRQNIVLSMADVAYSGVQIAHSLEEAYELAEAEPMVIGGANVYEQALPFTDRVYATEILASVPGADAFFPMFPSKEWRIDGEVDMRKPDSVNKYAHAFVTYLRKDPIE